MSEADVEMILEHGTPIRSGYILGNQDAKARISELKNEIHDIERLRNRVVIADGEAVITVYAASNRTQKRLFRIQARHFPWRTKCNQTERTPGSATAKNRRISNAVLLMTELAEKVGMVAVRTM